MMDRPGHCQGCGASSHDQYCNKCDVDYEIVEEELEEIFYCPQCEDEIVEKEDDLCHYCLEVNAFDAKEGKADHQYLFNKENKGEEK